jgi:hypothetical protein
MSAIDALAIGQGDTLLVIGATPAGSAASPSSSPPPQGTTAISGVLPTAPQRADIRAAAPTSTA